MFDDNKWLGSDARFAPSARAGLGILLARNVRFVPTDPREIGRLLKRNIPWHRVALWGHAPQVLAASDFVEPGLAIQVAEALKDIVEREGLRIRVSKSVWEQQPASVDAIVSDLSQVVSPEHVFVEWPGRASVPLPTTRRAQSNRLVVEASNLVRSEHPDGFHALPNATWQTDASATDVYVLSSQELPRTRVPTMVAIMVGAETNGTIERFLHSREQHRARCLISVPVDRVQARPWLEAFFSAWSERWTPIDDAVKAANAKTGQKARVVAATQTFILDSNSRFIRPDDGPSYLPLTSVERAPSGPAIESPRRDPEDDLVAPSSPWRPVDEPDSDLRTDGAPSKTGSRVLKEGAAFSTSARDARAGDGIALVESEDDSQPSTRVLDARLMSGSKLIRRLPTSGSIEILVDIRPKTKLDEDRQIFPDEEVKWQGDAKKFQVHMLELGSDPVTLAIDVPPYGRSTAACFDYALQNRRMDLRFIVSDGARILQTARLQGDPDDWVQFNVESIASPIAHHQSRFDLALLVNDSLGGEPSLTSLMDLRIQLSPISNTQADTARQEMLKILEGAVVNPDASTAQTLFYLANHGRLLLNYLRDHVEGWPLHIDRVQLTTQSDAFFPLEYLYDGQIPPNNVGGLCTESNACLSKGEAVPACPKRAALTQFCPMGFLGVTAVIERQTWLRGSPPGIWLASPTALNKREQITNVNPILFCASNEADQFDQEQDASPQRHLRTSDVVETLDCIRPNSWREWVNAIRSERPSLLMLVVHIENNELHLGADDTLIIGAISPAYIGNEHPIAIAIGCSSGYSRMVGAGLPYVLMREGARVVIAAMTDVLGRHANKSALELALALREAVSPESTEVVSIGELMLRLRRKLLVADIALGLALVAYGDASVVLAPNPFHKGAEHV
ncbi:hypothetical protein BTHE68_41260 [Burkholderia sp. THE68]|uniref:hypothetical protein n=1 Tax=Burkholderia sp. THE68 TaxID=758782 RepID=UPI0013173706|nr:hypothetical protein [Burkholderia sp. THE68]BBU30392.1 hypothetical protein BTHE68_41260 [Burkholderia sp. THE68]